MPRTCRFPLSVLLCAGRYDPCSPSNFSSGQKLLEWPETLGPRGDRLHGARPALAAPTADRTRYVQRFRGEGVKAALVLWAVLTPHSGVTLAFGFLTNSLNSAWSMSDRSDQSWSTIWRASSISSRSLSR